MATTDRRAKAGQGRSTPPRSGASGNGLCMVCRLSTDLRSLFILLAATGTVVIICGECLATAVRAVGHA